MARESQPKTRLKSFLELVSTIVVAVGLALLIQAFIVKPYRIPSGSMIPTLKIGQRVLTNRLAGNPGIGDIVVFHPPTGAEDPSNPICGAQDQGRGHPQACDSPLRQESSQTFIKRVVGVPGDRLSIVDGHVIRNGKREADGYIAACDGASGCTFRQTIVIPPGHYFMMGDNRADSLDSRYWGPVPSQWLIGSAFFTYWPPDRIGLL